MTSNDPARLDRIEALAERNREDIAILIEGQTRLQAVQIESAQTQAQIAQTQELLAQNLVELRAGQQRQDRILDYLLRQEGRRDEG